MNSSYLAVGYECNHNCMCCPLTTYDRLHRRLDFEEIRERIGLIGGDSTKNHIVLSGGEPMLHPDFLKILEYLQNTGFYVTVLSNSSQCRNEAFVRSIKDVMPEKKFDIVTAIHSSIPARHDKITGTQGSLLETLEGLDHLVEYGIPVTIKHIFNQISLPSLYDTFCYLEAHYPPNVSFQFCTMDYSGRAGKNIEKLFVSMDEIQKPFERVLDYLEKRMEKNREISVIESPLCLTDPYYWKYYNVASGGLNTYIAPNTDDKKAEYNVKSECGSFFAPCRDCSVQGWCAGTWRSAYQYRQSGLLRPFCNIKQ
ncbi:MAG: radical SAM protein [Eubacteriales bacterium]|nr:radical SAM protein [Eubacteriales bacterium]